LNSILTRKGWSGHWWRQRAFFYDSRTDCDKKSIAHEAAAIPPDLAVTLEP
jgi:hypothetical protein